MQSIDMDSILISTKKLAGLSEGYEDFDPDIILFINSTFSTLHQLGVGPAKGFKISNHSDKWSSYLPAEDNRLEMVKEFMYLKVKLVFDPPTISSVLKAYEDKIKELEFRIPVAVDEISAEEGLNE